MKYSIIIPVHNGGLTLPLTLCCLAGQTLGADSFELIVVDDASTDNTAEILTQAQSRFNLKIVTNPTCLGRSTSRNEGYRHSSGEILIFLDADMLVVPDWLVSYTATLNRTAANVVSGPRHNVQLPSTAAEPRLWLADLLETTPAELFQHDAAAQFRKLDSFSVPGQYPDPTSRSLATDIPQVCDEHPTSMLCAYACITSNVAVRRSAFAAVGGFDPFVRRQEDIELGIRLWQQRNRFVFAQRADAYHLFTPAEDRKTTDLEELAFFYRHPYALLLSMFMRRNGEPVINLLNGPSRREQHELLLKQRAGGFISLEESPAQISTYMAGLFDLPKSAAAQHVQDAIANGIVIAEREGAPALDTQLVTNWTRSRLQKESASCGTSYYLPAFTPALTYSGRWSVQLADPDKAASNGVSWKLPVPSEAYRQLEIYNWTPSHLPMRLDLDRRIIDVPEHEKPAAEISFDFVFTANGQSPAPADADDLHHRCDAQDLTHVQSVLKQARFALGAHGSLSALRLYRWLLENIPHCDNSFPQWSAAQTGFGNEAQRAFLFAELCRTLGIPARNRCGALFFGIPQQSGEIRIRSHTTGWNPFARSWVEAPEQGGRWMAFHFLPPYPPRPKTPPQSMIRFTTATPDFFYHQPLARAENANRNRPSPIFVPASFTIEMRVSSCHASVPHARAVHQDINCHARVK